MLGLAGLQCGLLSLARRPPWRWAGGRVAPGSWPTARRGATRSGAALGPVPRQVAVDTDDFTDRVLGLAAAAGGSRSAKRDAESLDRAAPRGGCCTARRRDVVLVDRPPVEGQPVAVEGLDLVADGDVGVQIGVAGARVAVGERGGDQALDVDLCDAVAAAAGVRCVVLDPGQGVGDGVAVAACSMTALTSRGAMAHRVETLLTGEKVRS